MGHTEEFAGHESNQKKKGTRSMTVTRDDFVLEKSIFNNIFEKDIRRIFIYKKAERLAKALHLITPAFVESTCLRNRIDAIAIGLVDAAVVPLGASRLALSRELLALSSVLSIARTGGLLSAMNADLITHEAHTLLQEIATYEEPRLFLDESLSLSGIAKSIQKHETQKPPKSARPPFRSTQNTPFRQTQSKDTNLKGHKKDNVDASFGHVKDRRDAILSVIRNKKKVSIKDISTLILGVSEKTVQRELSALVKSGLVRKQGERRWSVYSLV